MTSTDETRLTQEYKSRTRNKFLFTKIFSKRRITSDRYYRQKVGKISSISENREKEKFHGHFTSKQNFRFDKTTLNDVIRIRVINFPMERMCA